MTTLQDLETRVQALEERTCYDDSDLKEKLGYTSIPANENVQHEITTLANAIGSSEDSDSILGRLEALDGEQVGRVYFLRADTHESGATFKENSNDSEFLSIDNTSFKSLSLTYNDITKEAMTNAESGKTEGIFDVFFDMPYGGYSIEATSENSGNIIPASSSGCFTVDEKVKILNISPCLGEPQVTTQEEI